MHKTILLALQAGEIMLRNGSDTARVHRTVERFLEGDEIERTDIVVLGPSIYVTVVPHNGEPISMIRCIDSRMNNLQKLSMVTRIVDRYTTGGMTLDDAMEQLDKIYSLVTYPVWLKVASTCIVAFLFTIGFGGTIQSGLVNALITFFPATFMQFAYRKELPFFLSNIVAGGLISIMSLLLLSFHPLLHFDVMIASVIVIFTPGIMAITAIRDAVAGDFITGASRGIEALLLATALALGVGSIFALYMVMTGGASWTF